MSFLEKRLMVWLLSYASTFSGTLVVHGSDLTHFVHAFSDVCSKKKRIRTVLNSPCVQSHELETGVFDIEVIRSVLDLLEAPDASYSWPVLRQRLRNHHNLPVEKEETDCAIVACPAPSSPPDALDLVVNRSVECRAECEAEFEHYSREELLPLVSGQAAHIATLKAQLHRQRRKTKYWRRVASATKAKRARHHSRQQDDPWERPLKKRKQGSHGHLGWIGGFSMVLRRCASNLAAHALGLALMTDVHRTTVTKWEIRLRAATLAAARRFHRFCQLVLKTCSVPDDSWLFQIHTMRGDATNSKVWQKCKLRVSELCSYYVLEPVSATSEWSDVLSCVQRQYMVGDLLKVEHGTGQGCHAMLVKQAASTGVLTGQGGLAAIADTDDCGDVLVHEPAGGIGKASQQRVLTFIVLGSDAGPD